MHHSLILLALQFLLLVAAEKTEHAKYIIVTKVEHSHLNEKLSTKLNRLAKRGMQVEQMSFKNHQVLSTVITRQEASDLKTEFPDAVIAEDGPVSGSGIQKQDYPSWGLSRISSRWLDVSFDDIQQKIGKAYSKNQPYLYDDGLFANANDLMVYVLDTGIDFNATSEINFRVGPTFIDGTTNSKDDNGHGTHIAGIIGSKTYGVAKGVQITAVKVLDRNEVAQWSNVVMGLNWVSNDIDANKYSRVVINMSINGGINAAVDTLLKEMINRQITIVSSAGNAKSDACQNSPGHLDQVIVVGATDKFDQLWNGDTLGSNYGSCIDLFAPGANVPSTVPIFTGSTSAQWSGTSMAAPFVTGAVAQYLAVNGKTSPAKIQQDLIDRATVGVLDEDQLKGAPNRLLYSFSPQSESKCPGVFALDDLSDSLRLISRRLTSNNLPATDSNSLKKKFISNNFQEAALVLVPKTDAGSYFAFSLADYSTQSVDYCFDASSYDMLSFGYKGPVGSNVYVQASIGDPSSMCGRIAFKSKLRVQNYIKFIETSSLYKNDLVPVEIPLRDFCTAFNSVSGIHHVFADRTDSKWCLMALQRLSFQDFTATDGYSHFAFGYPRLYSNCGLQPNTSSIVRAKRAVDDEL